MGYSTVVQTQTIIFMGLQGSGKGTQVKLLKEYISAQDPGVPLVHFDAGGHLRAFFAEGGYTQEMVKASMDLGEIQPSFLPSYLWSRLFISELHGAEHLLMDGSPRALVEAELLDGALKFYKREQPTVLFLNVSEEEGMKRLVKRGRHDDTEEGIKERFRWYREIVMSSLNYYRDKEGYRVLEINGEQTPAEVHADVIKALGL